MIARSLSEALSALVPMALAARHGGGPPPAPPPTAVHQIFEHQAHRTPAATAVQFGHESLTYAELNAQADHLSDHLRGLHIGPDVPVGLCVERSVAMVVAVLGILKAGGAYVPLDPALPPERLGFILNQADCPVVVTQHAWLPLLRQAQRGTEPSPNYVVMDSRLQRVASPPPHPPTTTPHDLAYVLFTSGSTGQPKGVAMPHQPLLNLIAWQCAESSMTPGDRTLQFASLGFDVSFQEMFATWGSGGTLVLVTDDVRKDPIALLDALTRYQIHRLFLPFFVLERLADAATTQSAMPTALREVLVAGEQLRLGDQIRRFFTRLPGCRLWNQYGPTETHVVTSYELTGPPASWPALPPIGRPLPQARVYLLDGGGCEVATGETGELYLAGEVLARGYVNAPKLTAERFVPDPSSGLTGARMYKTGDLGRWLPDGNLEFIGRSDHQIKIRGYRIELGEIEVSLEEHPDLKACAVMPRDCGGRGHQLAAYVVAHNGTSLTSSVLRQWLTHKLPDYMVPAHYFQLAALPLSANGKVDRQALSGWQGAELPVGTTYVAPRNPMEQELVAIWQQLFERHDIGCHDNFFDLGGHSMLAARLAAELEQHFAVKLPISALFQSPTIDSLAKRLNQKVWEPQWSSLVPLQPHGHRPPFYFIHGWGGDVFCFLDISHQLPADQPVYGMQAVGLDGSSDRHTRVEDMAAHYVREMRLFQPQGPYFLGGYSLGGLIAYEVAQQLHRQGQRVALLALLDSEPIGGMPWTVYAQIMGSHFAQRCGHHLRQWYNAPDRRAYLRQRWNTLRFLLDRNRPKPPPAMDAATTLSNNKPQIDGYDDYYLAVASTYRLRHYPGTADVFLSNESDRRWLSCWDHLARGGVTFHHTPCTLHAQIIEPEFVPELARALTGALQRAHDREGLARETIPS